VAGPILNASPFIQQREALPGPLKTILDTLFPLDDPTMGMTPGPIGGMAVEAPTSLVRALSPLAKGSLQRGQELASELAGRAVPQPTQPNPLVETFLKFMRTAEPPAVDPNVIAATSKVTGSRPSKANFLQAPEGFNFAKDPNAKGYSPLPMARDPKIAAIRKLWDSVPAKKSEGLNAPIKSNQNERPPLSGKWYTKAKDQVNQKKALTRDLKKTK